MESNVPREQLIEINLVDDILIIYGNYAICWSGSLSFTTERSRKTLIGSAVSGEGLVNIYKGTGRIFLSPLVIQGQWPVLQDKKQRTALLQAGSSLFINNSPSI